VEGRFLQADDVASLRSRAVEAESAGVDALFVSDTPTGDPVVLAAALSGVVRRPMLGIGTTLVPDGRHPAILARELTCLDLICGGRSILCFRPPFIDGLHEVMAMCRKLWREGAVSGRAGPFRVEGAVNRPHPAGVAPLLALDLTGSVPAPGELVAATDMVLRPSVLEGNCTMEHV
jgi:alkanesulfonate monooxygenase SsuD/methylene tetrahydromethanopterin reductase-like flavin-dependent oxidoreductase (luciferase family)